MIEIRFIALGFAITLGILALIHSTNHIIVQGQIIPPSSPVGDAGNMTGNLTGENMTGLESENMTGLDTSAASPAGLSCDPNVPWTNCGGGH
jgi:hypothetical protein